MKWLLYPLHLPVTSAPVPATSALADASAPASASVSLLKMKELWQAQSLSAYKKNYTCSVTL